jgi:hypothetical protein
VLFVALVAACFVLARAFAARGDRPWSVAAAAVGVALPVFLTLGLLAPAEDPQSLSLWLRCITLVGWGFAALVAFRVRARLGSSDRADAIAVR